MKPSSPVARQQMKPLTPEEMKEQQMRMYLQKKSALAEGVLFNMVQGNIVSDAKGIVKIADDIATEFMKVVYKVEVTKNGVELTEE